MDRLSITERYHAEKPGPGFTRKVYLSPESDAVIRLDLAPAGRRERIAAPIAPYGGTFAQNLFFEIPGRLQASTRPCRWPRMCRTATARQGREGRGKSRRPSPQRLHHHHLP